MKAIMHYIRVSALAVVLPGIVTAAPDDQVDGHFSSWEKVPGLIESIGSDSYRDQLEQLHRGDP